MRAAALAIALAVLSRAAGSRPVQDKAASADTVVDVARSAGLTSLVDALDAAEISSSLERGGPFTVFGPTNAALAELAMSLGISLPELLERPDLPAILTFHVVPGLVLAETLADGERLQTMEGDAVVVALNSTGAFVNGIPVIETDLLGSNGVVHVIGGVLLPPPRSPPPAASRTVVDVALSSGLTALGQALTAADLVDSLQGPGPFTVFGPTDAAFADLASALGLTLPQLLDLPNLPDILTYHVASGRVLAEDLTDGERIQTLEGGALTVALNAQGAFVNEIRIIQTDLEASNGVVHIIAGVLVPPPPPPPPVATPLTEVARMSGLTDLVSALSVTGLLDSLQAAGPFTLFGPSNAAFQALAASLGLSLAELLEQADLPAILAYHVAGGELLAQDLTDGERIATLEGQQAVITLNAMGAFINAVQIVRTDVIASNGVLHIIDGVLLPPEIGPPLPSPQSPPGGEKQQSVVDVALAHGLSDLGQALEVAGLADTLSAPGSFTLFAPSNAAFAALASALGTTVPALLDRTDLPEILKYHVAPRTILAEDLRDGEQITTIQGEAVEILIKGPRDVQVNTVQITQTDLVASNGVVHVIAGVLLPPPGPAPRSSPPPPPLPLIGAALEGGLIDLLSALAETGLASTLRGAGPFTVFAPSDRAFAALAAAMGVTLPELFQLPDLPEILAFHVARGMILAQDLQDGEKIPTLEGQPVQIQLNATGAFVSGVAIVATDLVASNGVLHVIDGVLLPPSSGPPASPVLPQTVVDIAVANGLTDLAQALEEADLVSTLQGPGPFTVFAPSNSAFEALAASAGVSVQELLLRLPNLPATLTYHVAPARILAEDLRDGERIPTVQGSTVQIALSQAGAFVNSVQIIQTDLIAANGVVHIIAGVLLPPHASPPPAPAARTVLDVAEANGLTDLGQAIEAAGLTSTLQGPGPFTVFAPSNSAFAALSATLGLSLSEILALPDLGEILEYHVVPAKILAQDLFDDEGIETLLGDSLLVTVDAGGAKVNTVQIVTTDLAAANGVVHVIAGVLLPPTLGAAEEGGGAARSRGDRGWGRSQGQ